MNTLIADFETYYDKDVTLKKMNYSEYVPKAEPILLAARLNAQHILLWDKDNQTHFFNSIDWPNTTLVGHNLQFDALVLKHWFGRQAAYHIDTLCMARYLYPTLKHDLESLREHLAPHVPAKQHSSLADVKGLHRHAMNPHQMAELAKYCVNDVAITEALYYALKPQVEQRELDLIDWTIRLFLNPVLKLNTELATQAIEEEQTLTTELLNLHGLTAETVRSNAKFFNHLVAQGYKPPTKWSAKTEKVVPAFAKTDTDFADFCIENGIEDLYEVKQRLNSNIKETKTARLISAANENNGLVPVAYNYHGAFTGRFCLVGETQIHVLREGVVLCILLPELLPDDLIWDGDSFVSHGGLIHQGEQEVMTYDGITGTPDHRVYTDEVPEAVELRTASERNYTIKIAQPAPKHWTNTDNP